MNNDVQKLKLILLPTMLVVLLVIFDQLSKLLASTTLGGSDGKALIDGVLHLVYTLNDGMAWSILSGQVWLFLILTPILCILILIFYIRVPFNRHFLPLKFCLIFLLSGALGNFIDRLTLGAVRDFIYFKIINFPIFNVADIYVTLSIIFIVLLMIFKYKDKDLEIIFKSKKKDKDE